MASNEEICTETQVVVEVSDGTERLIISSYIPQFYLKIWWYNIIHDMSDNVSNPYITDSEPISIDFRIQDIIDRSYVTILRDTFSSRYNLGETYYQDQVVEKIEQAVDMKLLGYFSNPYWYSKYVVNVEATVSIERNYYGQDIVADEYDNGVEDEFDDGVEDELEMMVVESGDMELDENHNVCAICLDGLFEENCTEERVVVKLPYCNHVFHVGCVGKWFVKTPLCPLCRSKVRI